MRRIHRCQVCGKRVKYGLINCEQHSYVQQRMCSLAQDIYQMDKRISTSVVKELAMKHKCSVSTVYNHLKRQGYEPLRGWKQKRGE